MYSICDLAKKSLLLKHHTDNSVPISHNAVMAMVLNQYCESQYNGTHIRIRCLYLSLISLKLVIRKKFYTGLHNTITLIEESSFSILERCISRWQNINYLFSQLPILDKSVEREYGKEKLREANISKFYTVFPNPCIPWEFQVYIN